MTDASQSPPDCDCLCLTGAHDESCTYIRFVRSSRYMPDLDIPQCLRREKKPTQSGVFD